MYLYCNTFVLCLRQHQNCRSDVQILVNWIGVISFFWSISLKLLFIDVASSCPTILCEDFVQRFIMFVNSLEGICEDFVQRFIMFVDSLEGMSLGASWPTPELYVYIVYSCALQILRELFFSYPRFTFELHVFALWVLDFCMENVKFDCFY